MPNLDCSVKTCYYNKESRCCLDGIRVKGAQAVTADSTACGSFKEKTEGTFVNSCECSMPPEQTLSVQCEAVNCTHNDGKKCVAKAIDICGCNAKNFTDTECETFAKK